MWSGCIYIALCSGQMSLCYWTVPQQVVSHPNILFQPKIHSIMQAGLSKAAQAKYPSQRSFVIPATILCHSGEITGLSVLMDLDLRLRGDETTPQPALFGWTANNRECQWKAWLLWSSSILGMKDKLDCSVDRSLNPRTILWHAREKLNTRIQSCPREACCYQIHSAYLYSLFDWI